MGRIKPTIVKKTAEKLLEEEITFTSSFERNKKLLKGHMPSKKLRNKIAGYISRLKKREAKQAA